MKQLLAEHTRWIHANGSLKTAELEKRYPFSWQTIDAEDCLDQPEPTEGSVAAVLFKLQVGAHCPSAVNTVIKVLASDIEFVNPLGESQHRLDRERLTPELLAAAQEKMMALYTHGPFSVAWIMAYALQDYQTNQAQQSVPAGPAKIMELILEANYEALTAQEIKENFVPRYNAWLGLIELGQGKARQLKLRNKGEELAYPLDQATAELMINHKILPAELFTQLIELDGEPRSYQQHLDRVTYQQIAVSLLGLTASAGS